MDLRAADAALQAKIDGDVLAGVGYAVLRGDEVVARNCLGWADRERRVPMREDHLFRIFSNTKLVTSCAALQLLEQGRFGLDDPVGEYLPALAHLRALKPGATDLDDTEPAQPVRIRHLLTHTAGFTYAFVDPTAPIAHAYQQAGISSWQRTLAQQVEALGRLPLLFQPGSAWSYSVATDVVGRLIEVLNGAPLDACLRRQVFEPLGLRDTGFHVAPEDAGRLATMYVGDLKQPLRPGLRRAEELPFPGAYLEPMPWLNGGGGLVSSLRDYTALMRALLRGGAPLLKPQTMELVTRNQLEPGRWIGLQGLPVQEGRGHSFACAVRVEASAADPGSPVGDLSWGGLAGTQWCIWPRENLAAVLMTQRYMGHVLPFWTEFKQHLRAALA
jgi:CubicO group peptidase (beta-lactamase class C family)